LKTLPTVETIVPLKFIIWCNNKTNSKGYWRVSTGFRFKNSYTSTFIFIGNYTCPRWVL